MAEAKRNRPPAAPGVIPIDTTDDLPEDQDLDDLVSALNASSSPAADTRVDAWVRAMLERGASDLFLAAGDRPLIRIDGRLHRLEGPVLDGEDIANAIVPLLPPALRQRYLRDRSIDASLEWPPAGRLRINLHQERGRAAASLRPVPNRTPDIESLGLPSNVTLLSQAAHGLILIGGPTGSGKSTTLAAIVDRINRTEPRRIIAIEDPIEFNHANQVGMIEQIEIGIDAPDCASALRSVVRQAPDVIVVGEMREPETMRLALAAAETGHLVFATIHATDISSALSRIADSFPAERQPTIRQELAMALSAVWMQMLLPSQRAGRVPACELLMMSYGARRHVRTNQLQHLHQEITITRRLGSFSLEDSLAALVKAGHIASHEAVLRANHPDDLRDLLAR